MMPFRHLRRRPALFSNAVLEKCNGMEHGSNVGQVSNLSAVELKTAIFRQTGWKPVQLDEDASRGPWIAKPQAAVIRHPSFAL
jgi:hypothetical protein